MDDRIDDWASLLVAYSLELEEGDRLGLTYAPGAKELALAVVRHAVRRGVHVDTNVSDEEIERVFYEHASEDQLEDLPEYEVQKAEALDASLRIRASANTKELAAVPAAKQQRRSKAQEPLKRELIENTRWSLTQFPTRARAQQAGMAYEAYREFVLDACVKDWEQEAERYEPLQAAVDAGSEVRIVGEETDLTFSIGREDGVNRVGVLSDGTSNVPGGEVFTAPVRESVEGTIYFEIPAIEGGKDVEGVTLTFEEGEVVDASAETGEEVLEERLGTDDGARFVGEFGIGTNFAIDRFTRNTLFDEKIGGTVHLALGQAYRECLAAVIEPDEVDAALDDDRLAELIPVVCEALREDGYEDAVADLEAAAQEAAAAIREVWEDRQETVDAQLNESAVHWDMIKDLREGGRFEIDGETVLRDGEFVGIETL